MVRAILVPGRRCLLGGSGDLVTTSPRLLSNGLRGLGFYGYICMYRLHG